MQWWSWVLTAVGVCGLWLAGRKSPWGWAVGLGAQGLWFAYAISTRQYGFLVSCFAYGTVYVVNLRKWRKPDLPSGEQRLPPSDISCKGCS